MTRFEQKFYDAETEAFNNYQSCRQSRDACFEQSEEFCESALSYYESYLERATKYYYAAVLAHRGLSALRVVAGDDAAKEFLKIPGALREVQLPPDNDTPRSSEAVPF